jgi:hypothetical protein
MNQPEIIPPEKPESISGKLKQLLLPPSPQLPQQSTEGSPSPAASTSESSSEFDATAAEVEGKYTGIPADSPGADSPGQSGAAAEPGHVGAVVTPEVVEAFLVMLTESIAHRHGSHWRMTDPERIVLVPVNTAMINEQVPKLFGNLDNPALWAWCLVMGGWIGTKSETVGKAVEAGVMKIISIISGGGGKVAG